MNIYNEKPLLKPTFFQRLFSKSQKENAIIEINNLLALYQTDIEKVSLDNIIAISNKYKINLKQTYKVTRLNLFRAYLLYCLTDEKLDNSEIRILKHIREILLLNEKDTETQIKLATEEIFEKQIKDAVGDGKLTEQEKENLETIRKNLLLSEDIVGKLYEKNIKEIMQKFVDEAISDERFSPDEETELNEIAKSLGIEMKIDDKSKATLDKYKLYWQIENSNLPELTPDIAIQKNEKLHYRARIKWLEQRRVTKRINYGGPTARIKIAKGVYYRVGSIKTQSISQDVWQTIDSGLVYLTNKRLIFMGSKGNKTIPLAKILDIKPYKNGIDIQKDSGKNPFFEFYANADIFSMILVRLMNEQ